MVGHLTFLSSNSVLMTLTILGNHSPQFFPLHVFVHHRDLTEIHTENATRDAF